MYKSSVHVSSYIKCTTLKGILSYIIIVICRGTEYIYVSPVQHSTKLPHYHLLTSKRLNMLYKITFTVTLLFLSIKPLTLTSCIVIYIEWVDIVVVELHSCIKFQQVVMTKQVRIHSKRSTSKLKYHSHKISLACHGENKLNSPSYPMIYIDRSNYAYRYNVCFRSE